MSLASWSRARAAMAGFLLCALWLAPTWPAGADEAVGTDHEPKPPSEAARDAKGPTDFLEFSSTLTADCMLHRSQLRQIANTSADRAIRVVLWSYTGKTRSQGSSTKTLQPGAAPVPLGCDGTSGLQRRWEIESAEFVEPGGTND
ncbi:hypothetical protein [Salinisphaera sp. T31B1]|uniref:hypothetical protein n=1 Tax=Salinisphaera sp. T31B1 TaxID=727963 RepID=UPI0033415894